MKESVYKNYGEATVPGTSPSSGYELMHEPDFPVLRVGSCMVVPKEKYIQWMEEMCIRDRHMSAINMWMPLSRETIISLQMTIVQL